MAKTKIVIGNWKMKLGAGQSLRLAESLRSLSAAGKFKGEIVICPDFTVLEDVGRIIKKTPIRLGAQNAALEGRGALTGEVSPLNLKELGAYYVIIGHSERREIMGETDALINKKMAAVLETKKLIPILCVGEKRRGQDPAAVFQKQLTADLKNIKIAPAQKIIVAYEPLWAIGTGKVITGKEVLRAHAAVRHILEKIYSPAIFARNFRLVYGGSVDEKNAANFAGLADVDGVLVGGASLTAVKFWKICVSLLKSARRPE